MGGSGDPHLLVLGRGVSVDHARTRVVAAGVRDDGGSADGVGHVKDVGRASRVQANATHDAALPDLGGHLEVFRVGGNVVGEASGGIDPFRCAFSALRSWDAPMRGQRRPVQRRWCAGSVGVQPYVADVGNADGEWASVCHLTSVAEIPRIGGRVSPTPDRREMPPRARADPDSFLCGGRAVVLVPLAFVGGAATVDAVETLLDGKVTLDRHGIGEVGVDEILDDAVEQRPLGDGV